MFPGACDRPAAGSPQAAHRSAIQVVSASSANSICSRRDSCRVTTLQPRIGPQAPSGATLTHNDPGDENACKVRREVSPFGGTVLGKEGLRYFESGAQQETAQHREREAARCDDARAEESECEVSQ